MSHEAEMPGREVGEAVFKIVDSLRALVSSIVPDGESTPL